MPAWSGYGGPFDDIEDLVGAIDRSYEEGLKPDDYPLKKIESLAEQMRKGLESGTPPATSLMANLDLLATDTFISYGYHLLAGRIYTEITDGEWSDYIWEADLDAILTEALSTGNVEGMLRSLVPPHSEYEELRDALAQYREIALSGGWTEVPAGQSMKLGFRDPRVALLRQRLIATGDLSEDPAMDEQLFDDMVDEAVLRFQWRHGLWPDGVVGPKTIAAMNVPVESRINQIELNMERWRWLPSDLGGNYIFVNTAAFELRVVEFGETVMKMRIVVGKPYWHTPSFSSKMTYLVLNPAWNVPRTIAAEEILPKVQGDPSYLEREGFMLMRGSGKNAEVIDPGAIDWDSVTEDNLGFRFVQAPSSQNPLGKIKFMFPNRFSVYLHDTPSKSLFNRAVRTFSHGCIRIEKPIELASYLLPNLTEQELMEMIDQGEQLEVPLSAPIAVHTLYWTAWVDSDGAVNFRDDIYGRDETLFELLSEPPMTP